MAIRSSQLGLTPQTRAELRRRVEINEGIRLARYLDSRQIPTIGTGYNIQARGTQPLAAVGVVDVQAVASGNDSQAPGAARYRLTDLRAQHPDTAWAPAHAGQTFIAGITQAQNDALLDRDIDSFGNAAAALLPQGIFDALAPARQVAWCDMAFNMGTGEDGLGGFHQTISVLVQAQRAKDAGAPNAHQLFEEVGQHLENSAFFRQVGDRAKRDVAMMRTGAFVNPTGDGSA